MDFPIEMYKITPTTTKIKVTCQKCTGIGIVDDNCKYCGGKGTHYKTLAFWKIASKPVIIEKINRSKNGELRYWGDSSSFFAEDGKYLHFTKEDAEKECNRRNSQIASIIEVMERNEKTKS